MTTLSIPRHPFDIIDSGESMVCVYCDTETTLPYCAGCQEYKGLMTIEDWEAYTGEKWED